MKHNHGFTLIEVLVALSVLSVALTAVMLANIEHIRNIDHLTQKTYAHFVAMNVLTQIQVGMTDVPLSPNKGTGMMQMGIREWQWQAHREITHDPDVYKLSITVYDTKAYPYTSLEGYLLRSEE